MRYVYNIHTALLYVYSSICSSETQKPRARIQHDLHVRAYWTLVAFIRCVRVWAGRRDFYKFHRRHQFRFPLSSSMAPPLLPQCKCTSRIVSHIHACVYACSVGIVFFPLHLLVRSNFCAVRLSAYASFACWFIVQMCNAAAAAAGALGSSSSQNVYHSCVAERMHCVYTIHIMC